MLIPILLIFLACSSAAVAAYGFSPQLAQYTHGFDIILFSWRWQWMLLAASLILSIVLIGMVVSGMRRAWWLIGLAPVTALFLHRINASTSMMVLEAPAFVSADAVRNVADDDYVVGLKFSNQAYAYPYAALYQTPVVVQQEHGDRLILLWSAFANRALACEIKSEIRSRELQIVGAPANALLIYNSRRGQFINGVTGLTVQSQAPAGFGSALPVWKGTWGQWKKLNPKTVVLSANAADSAPRRPVAPAMPMGPTTRSSADAGLRVTLIDRPEPILLRSDAIGATPINVGTGPSAVVVFRDPDSGRVVAFDRQVEPDLFLRFVPNRNAARKGFMADPEGSDTTWSAEGRAIDGPYEKKGRRLKAVAVEEDLAWSVVEHWYPKLTLTEPPHTASPLPHGTLVTSTPTTRRSRRPRPTVRTRG